MWNGVLLRVLNCCKLVTGNYIFLMKESNITFVKSVSSFYYFCSLFGREIQAQSRLSPCSKLDYELYAPILSELYNPLAAEQYIVAEGESEKYALQVIKGSHFSERTYILAYYKGKDGSVLPRLSP